MKRNLACFLLMMSLLLSITTGAAWAREPSQEERNQIVALSSDVLISAGGKDWSKAGSDITKLKVLWTGIAQGDTSKEAKAAEEAFAGVERELGKAQRDPDALYASMSALVKAVDTYLSAGNPEETKEKAHKQVREKLIPLLKTSLTGVNAGDPAQARKAFTSFVNDWGKAETLIRQEDAKLYGSMEVKISTARIALNMEPMDTAKSTAKLQELIDALQSYADGKMADPAPADAGGETIGSISELLQLLDAVQADVTAGRGTDAAAKMDRFVAVWPSLEGEVMTRSQDDYNRVEEKMVAVPSLLLSNPPKLDQAGQALGELRGVLEPYAAASSYTAWDAGIILFREGLEAILIIAALVAFLNRSGNGDKRKWIWSGAGAGVVVSGIGAVLLSMVLSQLSTGSSRELIEGITGLVAVVFMIVIGVWLHNQSSLKAWNRFVQKNVGDSITKGALWSLFFTAFLSVAREGAETLIFYIGMAATIRTQDLLTGIVAALALLAVIGYLMIRLSSRIPIRPFFLLAGLLLYYMAFKFLGVSLHALQVTGNLPAHAADYLLHLPSLGLYSSWETTLPQLAVLLFVLTRFIPAGRLKAKMG